MLKRIPVEQVRVGMYLHELCGSWMDHPFWRSGFLIEDPHDIQRLRGSSVREVWIDAARGLDIEGGKESAAVEVEVEKVLESAQRDGKVTTHFDIAKEMERAGKIVATGTEAVGSMFREARMGRALDAAEAMPLVDEIASSVLRNPGAIISLARLKTKDRYTYMHSVAVCALMVALARQLGLQDEVVRQAGLAGLLHDVGKMAIPDAILNNPGKLTDAEFDLMKSHPALGHQMLLEGQGIDEMALDVCLHHHERMDGNGYPDRLPGERISLFARMGAVCDVYDAITSNRPYKDGWDPAESMRRMAEWSKGHFDEHVFQAFVKSVGIYPVGSLVRLKSGRLGVVVDQSEKSLLTPKVRVFYSTRSNARIPPELVNLALPGNADRIVANEDPQRWQFADLNAMWGGVALW